MSDLAEAASQPLAKSPPDDAQSSEARAARIAKFEREKVVVDCLNRGVSVAEIAAHLGIGEKRTRAVIREILAHRMPAPPEEFVAIQVGRLHEALQVAYSALGGQNLQAVDRVVRIVRELDRYHGLGPERRVPEPARLAPPAQNLASGAALTYSANITPQAIEYKPAIAMPMTAVAENAAFATRPENLAQSLEMVDSAPGSDWPPLDP
jgi:transposase-like protein